MTKRLLIDFQHAQDAIRITKMNEAKQAIATMCTMASRHIGTKGIYDSLTNYQQLRLHYVAHSLGKTIDDVVAMITDTDDSGREMAAALIMSSAVRTGYQERLQKTTIEQQSVFIKNIRKLPNGGKNAKHLYHSKKSIDFDGEITGASGKQYYVVFAAKYTDYEGGAQDNQCNDLLAFASNIDPSPDDVVIILLSDGKYYEKKRKRFNNKSFHDWINQDRHHDRLLATSTTMLDINLDRMIQQL